MKMTPSWASSLGSTVSWPGRTRAHSTGRAMSEPPSPQRHPWGDWSRMKERKQEMPNGAVDQQEWKQRLSTGTQGCVVSPHPG